LPHGQVQQNGRVCLYKLKYFEIVEKGGGKLALLSDDYDTTPLSPARWPNEQTGCGLPSTTVALAAAAAILVCVPEKA
jgi:hypothetical protein